MLRKSQLILAVALVILTSGVVSFAVSAAVVPQSFLAAGTTRYAVAQSTANQLFLHAEGWKAITGMSTSISVPTGKVADVFVIFCAEAESGDTNALQVKAVIAGTTALPGEVNFQGGTLTSDSPIASHCMTFYKLGVTAGLKYVKMQAYATNTFGDIYDHDMFVIANIH